MLMLYRPSHTDIRAPGSSRLAEYESFTFTLEEGRSASGRNQTDQEWLAYLYEHPATQPHWGNYVKGAAYFARIKCGPQIKLA